MVDFFIIIFDDDIGMVFMIIFVFLFDILGSYILVFYVVDESGNYNVCWGDVIVSGVVNSGCIIDEEVFVLICINGLMVILE